MPVDLPPTTPALGAKVGILLTTPPANPAAPTKAELNAGLFVQCHVYGALDGQPTQNTGAAPPKACTKDEEQRLGRVVWPSFDLQYSWMPQEAGTPGADGNEMYEACTPWSYKYLYLCDGLDGEATSALATGDVVNRGFRVQCGEQREGVTGDGEFDEFAVTQAFVPKGGRLVKNYVTPAA